MTCRGNHPDDRQRIRHPSRQPDRGDELCAKFPIWSIEDGFAEDDHAGDAVQLVGDDRYVTDAVRIRDGAANGYSNAALIKPNQIGRMMEIEAQTPGLRYGLVYPHGWALPASWICRPDLKHSDGISRGTLNLDAVAQWIAESAIGWADEPSWRG